MQLAGALCAEVKGLPPDGSPPSPETMVEVDSIGAKFARQATGLYTILRSNRLANDPKAPYLRLLLLRLNYNDFFFSAAEAAQKSARGGGGASVSSSISSLRSSVLGMPPSLSLTRR